MGEWKEYELGKVIDVRDGTHDSPKKKPEGKYLITSRHIKNGKIDLSQAYKISIEDFEQVNKRSKVDKWDILFSMIGTVGEMALVDFEPDFAIKNVGLFKTGDEDLARWIIYYLKSIEAQNEIHGNLKGTTQQYITLGDLRKFPIRIPSLPEQKAIAAVLSSLDDKIDLLHRQNRTLEAMAETLFRQWFVEDAREDWEEGCLGDVADNVRNGVSHNNISPGTIYVGLEHIDRKSISLNRFGCSDNLQSNKHLFRENDILFGKLRPYFHKVVFAPFSGVCSTDILVIRAKRPELLNFCLFAFYQSDVIEYANLGSEGTRMPRTNWNTLKQYPIMVPDDSLLSQYNQIVDHLINKIKRNQVQIRTLEQLRDTLLPKLMSGAVRVTV